MGFSTVSEVEENPGKEDVGVVRGGERVRKGKMLVKGVEKDVEQREREGR